MSDRDYYVPTEVAKILHTSPQMVRLSLQKGARGWDFPFIECGRNIKIPKAPFDKWLKGERTEIEDTEE